MDQRSRGTHGRRARVVGLTAKGLANRGIAQRLFVAGRTVEGHLTHAFRKVDVASREDFGAALEQ